MPEAKHTPGPWHVGPVYAITADMPQDINHDHFKGFSSPDYEGKYLIAESVVLDANRYLIAAAPNLLKALINALALAGSESPLWDEARSAIAEATATQP